MRNMFNQILVVLICLNAAHAVASSQGESSSSLKMSGFVDFRFSNYSPVNKPSVSTGNPESGFGLEDGAFYGQYEQAKWSLNFDLPFRRAKDVDLNSGATTPNQSSNGNITLGYDKAQFYAKYSLSPSLAVVFGQFDTIFGVELNDSKDRVFGKTGIVYDYTLPVTHAGLMLEYSNEGFYAKTFAANPNNKGSFGTSTSKDEQTEYALALGYSNENLRGQVGVMSRPIDSTAGVRDNRTLSDLTLGLTWGSFSLDMEYNLVTDPSKNTLTGAAADKENPGQGLLALAQVSLSDSLGFGLRYETVTDDPGAASLKSVESSGLSIHYKLDKDFIVRSEYVGYQVTNTSDVKWTESRANVAGVVSF